MFTRKIYRHLLIPAAALVTPDNKNGNGDQGSFVCRPSELPIYTREEDQKSDEAKKAKKLEVIKLPPPNVVEKVFATIREGLSTVKTGAHDIKVKSTELVEETQKNLEWVVNYLQEEENTNAKYGAIAIGGLTGYIIGLRGGFFRRTLFATAGALAMASVCYPEEAAEYSELAVEEGRKYATIAYNFIYGENLEYEKKEVSGIEEIHHDDEVQLLLEESEIDPEQLVSQVYEEATHKACHCPIGVCTRHDEQPPPPPPPAESPENPPPADNKKV